MDTGRWNSPLQFLPWPKNMEDFAEIADMEMLIIDKDTTIRNFKQDLRNNEVYYMRLTEHWDKSLSPTPLKEGLYMPYIQDYY